MSELAGGFLFRGARALVILHERQLRAFVASWRQAQVAGTSLPAASDPAYRSREALLLHVLEEARECLVWTCAQLLLPDPGIDPLPDPEGVEERVDAYLEHLLGRWISPLSAVPAERFYDVAYQEAWGERYTIAARLEHAVVHPMRHQLQLEELLAAQGGRG